MSEEDKKPTQSDGPLKALLARAADALVNENHVWFNEGDELVQELRKAARVILAP